MSAAQGQFCDLFKSASQFVLRVTERGVSVGRAGAGRMAKFRACTAVVVAELKGLDGWGFAVHLGHLQTRAVVVE